MGDTKFKKCLNQGSIRKFSRGPSLVKKELKNTKRDLKSAHSSYKDDSFKWATIQAYYSMFHSARALLYAKEYREKNHWCLIVAMRELYVNEGELSFRLVEALQQGKTLREEADYYGEFTKDKAKSLIQKAKKFFEEVKRIMKNN